MSSSWGPTRRLLDPSEPPRTDPGPQVTAESVVSMVVQRLEFAGTGAVVTAESLDEAAHGAALLLAALGALG